MCVCRYSCPAYNRETYETYYIVETYETSRHRDILYSCPAYNRETYGGGFHRSHPPFMSTIHIQRSHPTFVSFDIVSAHMQSVSFRCLLLIHPHVVPMQVYNRETYDEATNLLLGYRGDALAEPLNSQRQILPVACVCVCARVCVCVCVCVCV